MPLLRWHRDMAADDFARLLRSMQLNLLLMRLWLHLESGCLAVAAGRYLVRRSVACLLRCKWRKIDAAMFVSGRTTHRREAGCWTVRCDAVDLAL